MLYGIQDSFNMYRYAKSGDPAIARAGIFQLVLYNFPDYCIL